jgi:3'-phosphoadenosine 5'-phosphosulfate sulfotransferase
MAKKKVRLTSQFNDKAGEHLPGEIIDLEEKQADIVIAGRGGVEVKAEAKKTTTKAADK